MNFLKEDNWLDAHKKTDIKPVMSTFIAVPRDFSCTQPQNAVHFQCI